MVTTDDSVLIKLKVMVDLHPVHITRILLIALNLCCQKIDLEQLALRQCILKVIMCLIIVTAVFFHLLSLLEMSQLHLKNSPKTSSFVKSPSGSKKVSDTRLFFLLPLASPEAPPFNRFFSCSNRDL